MRPFWETGLAPILAALRPRRVVEIGSLAGETTGRVLAALPPEAEFHVIDPAPEAGLLELSHEHSDRLVLHRDLSLNVLPELEPADLVLIDGDHNWYTVYNELRALRETSRRAGVPMPVCILHDVGWPYGRRDMYYNPETVPAEFRQEYSRDGIVLGRGALDPRGMNAGFANAVREGGPRNGVLTALEDFVAEHDETNRTILVPLQFGFGIFVEAGRLAAAPRLAPVLDELEGGGLREQMLAVARDLYLALLTDHFRALSGPSDLHVSQYLDLLGASLRGELSVEADLRLLHLVRRHWTGGAPDERILADPLPEFREGSLKRAQRFLAGESRSPLLVPSRLTRLDADGLASLTRELDALREGGIPGDFVDCGAGEGGTAIFLRGYANAWGPADRTVWIADQFARPTIDVIGERFARYGLLDSRVRYLQGGTAALADPELKRVALIHFGDTASVPVAEALERLYGRLSPGGIVYVEDARGSREAVEAARARLGISEPLEPAGAAALLWRKSTDWTAPGPAPVQARPPVPVAPRAAAGTRDLSIVVVLYNMRREAARSLHSLSRRYQRGVEELDYEVIVVENGSDPEERVDEEFVRSFGPEFVYVDIGPDASPSPASAVNRGIAESTGSVVAVMLDGAHVATPGLLDHALRALSAYGPAVVCTQYWYVGPGAQERAVAGGYSAEAEDELFRRIDWPTDGYELFDIGHPLLDDWFDPPFESGCLFVPRALLERVGGMHEGFERPGGGFVNLEFFDRLASDPAVTVVCLLGEASFHQFHGDSATNSLSELEVAQVVLAWSTEQVELTGRTLAPRGGRRPFRYVGHLPPAALRTKARRRISPHFRSQVAGPGEVSTGSTLIPEELSLAYLEAYWESGGAQETRWLGRPVRRTAADLVAYQELLARIRPEHVVVVHRGEAELALYLATICELLGHGSVVAVGPPIDAAPEHARLRYVDGESLEPETAARVKEIVGDGGPVVLFLAARASAAVTGAQFRLYSPLVPIDSYAVVEDTIVNGRPVWPEFGPGPGDVPLRFSGIFTVDRSFERFGPSFNRDGYVRRIAPDPAQE